MNNLNKKDKAQLTFWIEKNFINRLNSMVKKTGLSRSSYIGMCTKFIVEVQERGIIKHPQELEDLFDVHKRTDNNEPIISINAKNLKDEDIFQIIKSFRDIETDSDFVIVLKNKN